MEIVFFDTETGGTGKDASLCSFAYLIYETTTSKVIKGEVLYFYWEGMYISPGAHAVNGLTTEFLKKNCTDLEGNLDRMFKVLHRAHISGYNSVTFDMRIINDTLTTFKRPEVEESYHTDVMRIWRPHFRRNVKLTKVIELLDPPQILYDEFLRDAYGESVLEEKDHDAAYDTVNTLLAYLGAGGYDLL